MVQREAFNMADIFDLGGRVAVVTGGNGGIGLGMASRASDFVTGTAIPNDGGYSVQGG